MPDSVRQIGPRAGRRFASPLSRALARRHGLDLAQVAGSGPQGRIVRADIAAWLDGSTTSPDAVRTGPSTDLAFDAIPHTIGRRVLARRLTESKQQAPHFHVRIDCNVERVAQLRAGWRPEAGARPSINDFVVFAAARALRAVPGVNASWTAAAVHHFHAVNIAVAVAVGDGLATPVLHDADHKSLAQTGEALRALAAQARAGTLAPGATRGGTFSVSNLGGLGVREFTAVINPPQAAILAVGMAEARPVVRDGALAVAPMLTVVLGADHRVIDGALAARWLDSFRRHLENPQAQP